jgi:hypothetical protein
MRGAYGGDVRRVGGDVNGLYLRPSQTRTRCTRIDVAFDAADPSRIVAASASGSHYYIDRREGI